MDQLWKGREEENEKGGLERGRSGGVLGKGVLLKTLLCSWLSSVADCTLINGWNGEGNKGGCRDRDGESF